MIMYVLLCYPVSFHMLQLLLTGRPISSGNLYLCRGMLLSMQSVAAHKTCTS